MMLLLSCDMKNYVFFVNTLTPFRVCGGVYVYLQHVLERERETPEGKMPSAI